jgi:hypothetical protein
MSIENGQPEIAQPERKRSARRGWIEFIIAVVLVLAAPIVVSVQSGEANEPWDEIWLGNWPVLRCGHRGAPPARGGCAGARAAAGRAEGSRARGRAGLRSSRVACGTRPEYRECSSRLRRRPLQF